MVADAYPPVVVESDSALVSDLRPAVSDPALVSALRLVVSETAQVSVLPVAGCEFPAALLGKVALDAVGPGLAHRVSDWIRRMLCRSEQTSEPCWLVMPWE